MKISVKKDKVLFEPETGMDLFWIGKISSKNTSTSSWENDVVKSMTMSIKNVIIGLGCNRP